MKETCLSLSTSPETSTSHMTQGVEPILMPTSDPSHPAIDPRGLPVCKFRQCWEWWLQHAGIPQTTSSASQPAVAIWLDPCHTTFLLALKWLVTLRYLVKRGFAIIAGTLALGKAHCVPFFLPNFQGQAAVWIFLLALSYLCCTNSSVPKLRTPICFLAFFFSVESQWPNQ